MRIDRRRPRAALAIGTALTLASSACSSETGDGPTAVTIGASEYAFEAPAEIGAGAVTLTLDNAGVEDHHVQLARLPADMNFQGFTEALEQQGEAAFGLVQAAGGVGVIAGGAQASASMELRPGAYVMLCGVPGPEGVPHMALGMISPLQVTGPEGAGALPEPDQTVAMTEFGYDAGTSFDGAGVVRFVNEGGQDHEALLLSMQDAQVEDVLGFLGAPEGPPPFGFAGGLQAVLPGGAGQVDFDSLGLDPGRYALVCFVPDTDGVPHLAKGMVLEFERG